MIELSLQLNIHNYYLELKLMYRKRSYAIFSTSQKIVIPMLSLKSLYDTSTLTEAV